MAGAIPSATAALRRETKGLVVQAAQSGAITFDLSKGSMFEADLTGNVTGWSFTNVDSAADEVIEVHFVQDATGSRTLAGQAAAIKLAGGALTLSTGAGKRDIITFRRAGTNIYERSRSLNI